MKKLCLYFAVLLTFVGTAYSQNIVIKIKGSDTCLPLSQKEAEEFMKNNIGYSINVTGGGSSIGFASLINGTTNIAQTSRKINKEEIKKFKVAGKSDYKEKIIAYDALTVIVNPLNKVSNLTREQIEGIYTGKINNWKEVGGDDLSIVVYSRESSSGTYDFFKEHVLLGKDYISTALLMPATIAIVESVAQTKGAIGYIGFEYLGVNVKAIAVSYNKGKNYILPSIENVKNKKYPIARPLYYYYINTNSSNIKVFLKFVLSNKGQKIVESEGYIPIN